MLFGLALVGMGIFSIVQMVTKNSSAVSRQALYAKLRLFLIIAIVVMGIILFALVLLVLNGKANDKVNLGISLAIPLFVNAAILHGYHANFGA